MNDSVIVDVNCSIRCTISVVNFCRQSGKTHAIGKLILNPTLMRMTGILALVRFLLHCAMSKLEQQNHNKPPRDYFMYLLNYLPLLVFDG